MVTSLVMKKKKKKKKFIVHRKKHNTNSDVTTSTKVLCRAARIAETILMWLDYDNSTFAVSSQAASVGDELRCRLVFGWSRYDHVAPLLRQLQWIDFKLALLDYKQEDANELRQPAD